jgi:hypothetical protein
MSTSNMSSSLQLAGKLTEQELKDFGSLIRPKSYWPRLILSNAYGALLLLAVAWATVRGILEHEKLSRGLGILWLVILGIALYSIYRVRRSMRKALVDFNAMLPDAITLDAWGLHMKSANGSATSMPWSVFKSWRERGSVILLDNAKAKSGIILPLNSLAQADRELLRGTLRSHIG